MFPHPRLYQRRWVGTRRLRLRRRRRWSECLHSRTISPWEPENRAKPLPHRANVSLPDEESILLPVDSRPSKVASARGTDGHVHWKLGLRNAPRARVRSNGGVKTDLICGLIEHVTFRSESHGTHK